MILRLFSVGRIAALLLFGLGFGAAPAAAGGCGYNGCYAPAPVVYQSCGCCGCGSSYYTSYYAAYAYPAYAYPSGCCGYGAAGYGYGVGYGYGYGAGYGGVVAPPVYRARVAYPRYIGPRRHIGPRVLRARY